MVYPPLMGLTISKDSGSVRLSSCLEGSTRPWVQTTLEQSRVITTLTWSRTRNVEGNSLIPPPTFSHTTTGGQMIERTFFGVLAIILGAATGIVICFGIEAIIHTI